ncbi:MAG: ModD protein [Spirochaetaceae bacterium]|jgi:molybdenum transport protein|nr:ModD protein [Spirochaetaceae bacterium]
MLYYPDDLVDRWIMDDVNQGDLTTRILGFGAVRGTISFSLREPGRVSGVDAAEKVLRRLGLEITERLADGSDNDGSSSLIAAAGRAAALHQAWKVCQNILEWACGVAAYTSLMVRAAQAVNPAVQVAATRKNIPGTKLLALAAVLDGGGIIHRGGTSESILLFANHRRFLGFTGTGEDWKKIVAALKAEAPEKKIVVEADTREEALLALAADPDILQLDKFSPPDVRGIVEEAAKRGSRCLVSAAGGVTRENAAEYAAAGAGLIVSSAPYYAKPADVKVVLSPAGPDR